MAIQIPLTTPWKIIVPADTNEHTLDMTKCLNAKVFIGAAGGFKVRIIPTTGTIQFRVALIGAPANLIDSNNPSYTTTDEIIMTLYQNMEIRFKGAVGSEEFNLAI